MALAEIIKVGMDNPDCSFFVGVFTGQFVAFRYIVFLAVLYVVFKVVDKLALEPILEWIKKKIKR